MNGQLWLPQQASAPSPGDVAAYLLQQGWQVLSSNAQWAVYRKAMGETAFTIEVPQQTAAMDYPRVVGFLLEDLARIEKRPPGAVLRDLKASAVDIVRLAIDSAITRDGRIPVEAGRRVYEACRDLLLAAACAVLGPRPVFSKRKPDEAMKLLDRARFGQTEFGSFVLTMECSIAPRLEPSLPDLGDPDAPLERKTSVLLATALREAEAAVRESAATGSLDPFAKRMESGVSANLCDAVASIIDATTAETLAASFSFSGRRPLAKEVPREIRFSGDTAPILKEAATRLRDKATWADAEVAGSVVQLNSTNPADGGEVVLKAEIDGKLRSVRVDFDQTAYIQAIEAHRTGQWIRCTGELAREGNSMALRNARDVAVLRDTEPI